MSFTPTEKLQCVERELKYRNYVYPRQIEAGKISKEFAAKQISIMEEIVDDYRKLIKAEQLDF